MEQPPEAGRCTEAGEGSFALAQRSLVWARSLPKGSLLPLLPRPVLSVWPPKPSWSKEVRPLDEWVSVLDAWSTGGLPQLCH